MARTRSERETVATLRLPRDLHARLKQESGDRGFAAEVRRRLEASFDEPDWSKLPGVLRAADPETRKFLTALAAAAAFLGDRLSSWHADPASFVVFKEAATELLDLLRPEGEAVLKPPPGDKFAYLAESEDGFKSYALSVFAHAAGTYAALGDLEAMAGEGLSRQEAAARLEEAANRIEREGDAQ